MGSGQRKIIWFLFWFGLQGNVSAQYLVVLSRVTISWGFNTLGLNIISKLCDRTTSQWSHSFLCRNCQLAPPTWAIMRDSHGAHGANIWMSKWSQQSKLRPTRQIIRLSVITGEWKLLTFSHRRSSSQRTDIWQPTDREGTIPSWTEPTLDQLIIRFNASISSNYATPKWNKNTY